MTLSRGRQLRQSTIFNGLDALLTMIKFTCEAYHHPDRLLRFHSNYKRQINNLIGNAVHVATIIKIILVPLDSLCPILQ